MAGEKILQNCMVNDSNNKSKKPNGEC